VTDQSKKLIHTISAEFLIFTGQVGDQSSKRLQFHAQGVDRGLNEQSQVPKKNVDCNVRSSTAEYLAFVAACGSGGFEAIYADENI
jgi:hypothetical protein